MATERTPGGTPKPDKRPALNLRGPEYTPEFRSRLMAAAGELNMTQSAFVYRVLEPAIQRALKHEPLEAQAGLPAVVQDELVETTVQRVLAVLDAREANRKVWAKAEARAKQQRQVEARAETEDRQVEAQAEIEEQQRQADAKRGWIGGYLRRLWGGGAKESS